MTKNARNSTGTPTDPSNRPAELVYEIGGDEPPSEAVIKAVASFTESTVTDIEPLYYVGIDPEDLDGLFQGKDAEHLAEPSLTISLQGCTVTVEPDRVRVEADVDATD